MSRTLDPRPAFRLVSFDAFPTLPTRMFRSSPLFRTGNNHPFPAEKKTSVFQEGSLINFLHVARAESRPSGGSVRCSFASLRRVPVERIESEGKRASSAEPAPGRADRRREVLSIQVRETIREREGSPRNACPVFPCRVPPGGIPRAYGPTMPATF